MADVADVANSRDAVGEEGHNGQGHDGVADGVHVDVDRAERSAGDGRLGRLARHGAAHVFEDVDEREIALKARCAQAKGGDGAAGECGQGEEVAGRRGIGLDRVDAAAVPGRIDVEAAKLAIAGRHPERFHDREGHPNVRLGDEDSLHLDRRLAAA